MVNPFAPYLSIINFALEPILKIGFAIVVARDRHGRARLRPDRARRGLGRADGPVVHSGDLRCAGSDFFCVAVSLAAACVAVGGPPRRTPTTATPGSKRTRPSTLTSLRPTRKKSTRIRDSLNGNTTGPRGFHTRF